MIAAWETKDSHSFSERIMVLILSPPDKIGTQEYLV